MNTQRECPICMDSVEFNKNCVTTECGHCFHTSCLMRNVAHNGFDCPLCRYVMADEPEDEDDDDDVEEEEEEEMFYDDSLRAFRFFFNNLYGEEHDPEDISEEQEYQEYINEENGEEENNVNAPPISFVAERLLQQGVTFENLIHMVCNLDHEEYREDDAAEEFNDKLFGMIRIIVSNYQPEQTNIAQQPSQDAAAPVVMPANVDFEAQPKNVTIRSNSRIMTR